MAAAPAKSAAHDVGPVSDSRLHTQRGTNTRFSPVHYSSLQSWERQARRLRDQVLVSTGLLPMPRRTPLRQVISGRVDRGDYTVENVHFQSYPGLYVVGNLYRPKSPGPHPAVLNPHGHWEVGRVHEHERGSMAARCISLARQGFVAFTYSMLGYNEGNRIDHRFASHRHHLWGISPCGLQTYASIRAIDLLQSLPDVDPNRIACTGSSGGGTQTFLLTAVDQRVRVAAPVCMVSALMQGGCVCENGPLLRLDTNNVEITSLAAPRPLMLVAATGDWTRETLDLEYPAIRRVYELYGAVDEVDARLQDADHNYNLGSREIVYPWLGHRLLGMDDPDNFREQPYTPEPDEALLAFTDLPDDALDLDRLTEQMIDAHRRQVLGFGLRSRASLDNYRRTFGPALRACLAAEMPEPAQVTAEHRGTVTVDGCRVERLVIGRKGIGDAIPGLLFSTGASADPVLIVHSEGKSALLDGEAPGKLVRALLGRGHCVLAIDRFLTGEADAADERLKEQFFTTFYRTDAAERVQDVLTALGYLRSRQGVRRISVVGLGGAGLDCLFARALAPEVHAAVIDMNDFDCDSDEAFIEGFNIPLLRRVGDVRTALALGVSGRLAILNPGSSFPMDWARAACSAAGAPAAVRVLQGEPSIAGWLDADSR